MPEPPQIRCAGDLADRWDANRQQTSKWLDSFIESNPSWYNVLFVGSANAALDLGAGFVDVLRLGQGTAEGGWGYGKDALRLVGLLGPLGRGANVLRSGLNARAAAVIANSRGGVCAWVAATKALRHVGQRVGGRALVAVKDLAQAVGRPFPELGKVASLEQLVTDLRALGARIGAVTKTPTMKAVCESVPHNGGGGVLVNLNGVKNGARAGGHCVYVFRDSLRRIRIMDREGVYDSLEALAERYAGKVDRFEPIKAALVENIFGVYVDATEKAAVLAIEVLGATIDDDTAAAAAAAYDRGRAGVPSGARFHRVQAGETLASLALRYYGDANKWPILYGGNKLHIGDDPSRLRVDQTLWIPD